MRGGDLALEDYAGHIGTTFIATDAEGRPVLFDLVEATALKEAPHGETRAPFSLFFRTADQRQFEQGIIDLTHPAMGTLSLFVVPIGRDTEGARYEATFN